MEAYRATVQMGADGSLTLNHLPFEAGEEVEVIVARNPRDPRRYPLRGTPLHYERPFEPVAEGEWEALQ